MTRFHHIDSLFESMIDDVKDIKRTTYFINRNR